VANGGANPYGSLYNLWLSRAHGYYAQNARLDGVHGKVTVSSC
jgi:hypothetical protein